MKVRADLRTLIVLCALAATAGCTGGRSSGGRAPAEVVRAVAPEAVEGPFGARDLVRAPATALDVRLLDNMRAVVATRDSVLIVDLAGRVPPPDRWPLPPRTLPVSRDPSAIILRESDVGRGGPASRVLTTWHDGSGVFTFVEDLAALGRRPRAEFETADRESSALCRLISPAPGRNTFVVERDSTLGFGPPVEIYDLTFGDFDGDGAREPAAACVGEQVAILSERFPPDAKIESAGAAVAAGDLDGSPPDELVVTAPVGPGGADLLTVYRWDGAGFREIGRTPALPRLLIAADAADTDGDGRAEILVLEKRAGEAGMNLRLLRWTGGGR